MIEIQSAESLTKKERRQLRRKFEAENQQRVFQKNKIKRLIKFTLAALIIGGGIGTVVWYLAKAPSTSSQDIVSTNGIHWHPHLSIVISGQPQEIPANIGLGVVEKSIHTHDATGKIHLEFPSIVRKDNITLGQFFKVWNKQFNSNCIFDFCSGQQGTVKMLVNGQPSQEFDHYVMRDGDNIEIRYE